MGVALVQQKRERWPEGKKRRQKRGGEKQGEKRGGYRQIVIGSYVVENAPACWKGRILSTFGSVEVKCFHHVEASCFKGKEGGYILQTKYLKG